MFSCACFFFKSSATDFSSKRVALELRDVYNLGLSLLLVFLVSVSFKFVFVINLLPRLTFLYLAEVEGFTEVFFKGLISLVDYF